MGRAATTQYSGPGFQEAACYHETKAHPQDISCSASPLPWCFSAVFALSLSAQTIPTITSVAKCGFPGREAGARHSGGCFRHRRWAPILQPEVGLWSGGTYRQSDLRQPIPTGGFSFRITLRWRIRGVEIGLSAPLQRYPDCIRSGALQRRPNRSGHRRGTGLSAHFRGPVC